MILLDIEELKHTSFKSIVKAIERGIAEHQIPYRPKIVKLTNQQSGRHESRDKLSVQGFDYHLTNPILKQDFVKMCNELNYDYKEFAR